MAKISLERAPFARTNGARPQDRTLRRASLLIGTALFLDAAPAWAVNECGPPPPGGGTVTCPAGEYPHGITYFVHFQSDEFHIEPGFVARDGSYIEGSDVRFIGPVNTSFSTSPTPTPSGFSVGLFVFVLGPVVVDIDEAHGLKPGDGGLGVLGSRSVTVRANAVTSVGSTGVGVSEIFHSFAPVTAPITGVSLRVNSVSTTGNDATGISTSSEQGNVAVTAGTVKTAGDRSSGIIISRGAAVTIDAGSITTAGSNSPGISAVSTGPVAVTSGTVRTTGNNSNGIFASGSSVNVNSGSVTTSGRSVGIDVSTSTGSINVTSDSVVTQGAGSAFQEGAGIYAHGSTGKISVSAGTVTTTGTQAFGVYATSAGDISVASNMIATTGRLANAIYAVSNGGSIAVAAGGPLSTMGDSATGVVTFIAGPGSTSVKTGSITTKGFDSYGVIATSVGTGAIDVTGDGTIVTTGASSPGISAESNGGVTVSANNISTTGANSDAIAVKGSTSTVTIRGVVQSSQGFAIRGEGGLRQNSGPGGPVTATILAGGTLRGRVILTGGADRINNNGTFDAIGTSQFGAGSDLFENNAGATAQSVNGAATFAGLETFSNRGTVEMRDDAANDSLILPGAYVGAGGARLGLDVDFAAGTADRLVTGAATGSTLIEVRPIGSGTLTTSGILLVDAGAGTSPTAFALSPGADSAYLRSTLRFDAANNDFLLDRTVGPAIFETARFGAMASQLWYESADAVAAELDTERDGARRHGAALWLEGWTGEREREGTQTFAGAGTFDVSFDQDFQGLQGGLDFQSGRFVAGITAGTGRSDAAFVSGNPVDMKVSNLGLYGQLRAGPLYFNALAKRDWAQLEIDPGAGLGAEFDADLFGVQLNVGLRLGSGAVYAEPSVGLSWVKADLDSFESGPARVAPGSADSLRARAGLRVGANLPVGGGTLHPFAAVNVFEELGHDNETDFTLGETLHLFDEPAGTRGQAAAGLSFATAGFEAFVRGEMDFSGDSDARALRAGARLRF
jgi:hypothetical protein